MKKIMKISLFSAALLMLALPVFAAVGTAPENVTSIDDVIKIINTLVNWLFAIILAIAVIMLLWAAFLWMTSAGDEEKTGKARKTLIYALVGVAVAVVAKGLVKIVEALFK